MKNSVVLLVIMLFLVLTISSQNDTMYIMKNGVAVGKYNVNTQVDSVIFYKPQPPNSGTFTDSRDGNVYKWVKIGNQVWMAENLRYLQSVVAPTTGSTTTPCYYVYDYYGTDVNAAKATDNYKIYGVLYNWSAACASCPIGWHLPNVVEWYQLIDFLGGLSIADGKLKEVGTIHWASPNDDATNETGFRALPGGDRGSNGLFGAIGKFGHWWSSNDNAWGLLIANNYSMSGFSPKEVGFSVQCMKD